MMAFVDWFWFCHLFGGHDFVEDSRGRLYCLHCGMRPKVATSPDVRPRTLDGKD